MNDNTEFTRRVLVNVINSQVESDDIAKERARLETQYGAGNVWNTNELSERFEVIGFMAPFCTVKDRKTDEKGSVGFQHSPRFYFDFQKA